MIPSGALSLAWLSSTNCQLASTSGRAVSSEAPMRSGTSGITWVAVGTRTGVCVAVAGVLGVTVGNATVVDVCDGTGAAGDDVLSAVGRAVGRGVGWDVGVTVGLGVGAI